MFGSALTYFARTVAATTPHVRNLMTNRQIGLLGAQVLSKEYAKNNPLYRLMAAGVARENSIASGESLHSTVLPMHGAVRLPRQQDAIECGHAFGAWGMKYHDAYALNSIGKGALPVVGTTLISKDPFRLFVSLRNTTGFVEEGSELDRQIDAHLAKQPAMPETLLDLSLKACRDGGLPESEAYDQINSLVWHLLYRRYPVASKEFFYFLKKQGFDVLQDMVLYPGGLNHLTPGVVFPAQIANVYDKFEALCEAVNRADEQEIYEALVRFVGQEQAESIGITPRQLIDMANDRRNYVKEEAQETGRTIDPEALKNDGLSLIPLQGPVAIKGMSRGMVLLLKQFSYKALPYDVKVRGADGLIRMVKRVNEFGEVEDRGIGLTSEAIGRMRAHKDDALRALIPEDMLNKFKQICQETFGAAQSEIPQDKLDIYQRYAKKITDYLILNEFAYGTFTVNPNNLPKDGGQFTASQLVDFGALECHVQEHPGFFPVSTAEIFKGNIEVMDTNQGPKVTLPDPEEFVRSMIGPHKLNCSHQKLTAMQEQSLKDVTSQLKGFGVVLIPPHKIDDVSLGGLDKRKLASVA